MLVKKIKKAELYSRRAALAANTSLEILKQRRFNATTRVRGRVYAKQFLSDSVRGVLLDADSFVVVIKCVDTGTDWSTFLNTFSAKNLKVRSILPINNIRTLYSSLSAGLDLQ
jgi:hypothetical protein